MTTVPDTVRDIVLARVAQLGPQAAAVVEATSIAPPRLDAELLVAVCGEAADPSTNASPAASSGP